MLANEALAEIKAHLLTVYNAASNHERLLAIYRHESAELHCCLTIYLTEEFQNLALLKNAQRCYAPPLSDSGFLAGNQGVFEQ